MLLKSGAERSHRPSFSGWKKWGSSCMCEFGRRASLEPKSFHCCPVLVSGLLEGRNSGDMKVASYPCHYNSKELLVAPSLGPARPRVPSPSSVKEFHSLPPAPALSSSVTGLSSMLPCSACAREHLSGFSGGEI